MDRNFVFAALSSTVSLLNLFDTIATAIFVSYGFATEINPLMAFLLAHGGIFTFSFVKIGMVDAGLAILKMRPTSTWTLGALGIATAVYLAVAGAHAYVLYALRGLLN